MPPGFSLGWITGLLVAASTFARAQVDFGSQQAAMVNTNVVAVPAATNAPAGPPPTALAMFQDELAQARNLVVSREFKLAEEKLVKLLAENVPDEVRQPALFELGTAVAAENDLPRALSIYTQYLDRWPSDLRTPEILLRQGDLFHQMGLDNLALAKFYSVMTAALSLKTDQLPYYQRLVLQAQIKIAETYYQMGRYSDAAEFYARLLKQADPALNRPLAQFRYVRSLAATGHHSEAVAAAQDFLAHYPDDPEAPETRYYLAQSLKAEGQTAESLRQVLLFLSEEKKQAKDHPELWSYWQQRVGNEIGNSLYKEGDYVKALQIYLSLAKLDRAPEWQVPVQYQIGMTYEHLMQPEKAIETYGNILARETEVGTNATPGLKTVFDMARWRAGFVQWQVKADNLNHSLAAGNDTAISTTTNLP